MKLAIVVIFLVIVPNIEAVAKAAQEWADGMAKKIENAYNSHKKIEDAIKVVTEDNKEIPLGGRATLLRMIKENEYFRELNPVIHRRSEQKASFDTAETWAPYMASKLELFNRFHPNDDRGLKETLVDDRLQVPAGGAKALLELVKDKPYKGTVEEALKDRVLPQVLNGAIETSSD